MPMTRWLFVVDVDHDFQNNLEEAATWLEGQLDLSELFKTKVTAYRSVNDLVFDYNDKEGAFKHEPTL
jgi:hypothetical protein